MEIFPTDYFDWQAIWKYKNDLMKDHAVFFRCSSSLYLYIYRL